MDGAAHKLSLLDELLFIQKQKLQHTLKIHAIINQQISKTYQEGKNNNIVKAQNGVVAKASTQNKQQNNILKSLIQSNEQQIWQSCVQIVKALQKNTDSAWFRMPVDPIRDNVPDYFQVIKKPMALNTVQQKLKDRQYNNPQEFKADVKLIFDNCRLYNPSGNQVRQAGDILESQFDKRWSSLQIEQKWQEDVDQARQSLLKMQKDKSNQAQDTKVFPQTNTSQLADKEVKLPQATQVEESTPTPRQEETMQEVQKDMARCIPQQEEAMKMQVRQEIKLPPQNGLPHMTQQNEESQKKQKKEEVTQKTQKDEVQQKVQKEEVKQKVQKDEVLQKRVVQETPQVQKRKEAPLPAVKAEPLQQAIKKEPPTKGKIENTQIKKKVEMPAKKENLENSSLADKIEKQGGKVKGEQTQKLKKEEPVQVLQEQYKEAQRREELQQSEAYSQELIKNGKIINQKISVLGTSNVAYSLIQKGPDMTYKQKRWLSYKLSQLDQTQLPKVLDIVQQRNPTIKTDARSGVEYDFYIDDLPGQILWAISDHVNKLSKITDFKEILGNNQSKVEEEIANDSKLPDPQHSTAQVNQADSQNQKKQSKLAPTKNKQQNKKKVIQSSQQPQMQHTRQASPKVKATDQSIDDVATKKRKILENGNVIKKVEEIKPEEPKAIGLFANKDAWENFASTLEEDSKQKQVYYDNQKDNELFQQFKQKEEQQMQREMQLKEEQERLARQQQEEREKQLREEEDKKRKQEEEEQRAVEDEKREREERKQKELAEIRAEMEQYSPVHTTQYMLDYYGQFNMNQPATYNLGLQLRQFGNQASSEDDPNFSADEDDQDSHMVKDVKKENIDGDRCEKNSQETSAYTQHKQSDNVIIGNGNSNKIVGEQVNRIKMKDVEMEEGEL